jgi:serine/threonine protein kinase
MSVASGARLGAYEVIRLIGAGGMGEVYQARDTRLDRIVAVKVLPEKFADDHERRQRFEREARAVAALNHPHICDLHDVGEHDNVGFLVMEYLEGLTLADRLVRGPLPPADVLRYATELADALDHAHRRGLVHRDLKPGNVMLTKRGAKLLDFSLSKLQPTPDLIALSTIASDPAPLTAQGAVLGTYPCMAPEQLEGRETDARTDIFAFGAIVYEMATGQRAFQELRSRGSRDEFQKSRRQGTRSSGTQTASTSRPGAKRTRLGAMCSGTTAPGESCCAATPSRTSFTTTRSLETGSASCFLAPASPPSSTTSFQAKCSLGFASTSWHPETSLAATTLPPIQPASNSS